MNHFLESDLDYLAREYSVKVNGDNWDGRIAVGDTLEVNGLSYAVIGLNEDAVVVKRLEDTRGRNG